MSTAWRKSSRSGANYGCVETARIAEHIGVRDSKNPGGPVLSFTRTEWAAFTAEVKQS